MTQEVDLTLELVGTVQITPEEGEAPKGRMSGENATLLPASMMAPHPTMMQSGQGWVSPVSHLPTENLGGMKRKEMALQAVLKHEEQGRHLFRVL